MVIRYLGSVRGQTPLCTSNYRAHGDERAEALAPVDIDGSAIRIFSCSLQTQQHSRLTVENRE